MDFLQLRYFKTLAEFEHMTKAANALHIVQPALSRMLRNLERELGLLLFEREGKNIRLNENGKILLYHTNNILNEIKEAESVLADRKGNIERQVKLSMYAATSLMPDIIRSFKKSNPDISIKISQSGTSSEDHCDIMIDSGMQPPDRHNCMVLLQEEIILAVPVSHPLGSRKSVRLVEVAQAPFISLHKGSGLRTVTDAYCLEAGFQPKTVLESDSPHTLRDLIALGVGLCFVPKLTWAGMDYGSEVSLVDIEEPNCARYIYMMWSENRYIPSAAKLLQKHLTKHFAKLGKRK
ncbi:MAG: LysR family transcriptional regulator [Treponema sp.]|nr:LysR family transcriptional regulator [Treponema sp.]